MSWKLRLFSGSCVLTLCFAPIVSLADQQFFSASVEPTTLQFGQRSTGFSRTDTDTFSTVLFVPKFNGDLEELNFVAVGYATEENPFFAGAMFAPPSITAGVNANIQANYELTAPGAGVISGDRFFNASRTINSPNSTTEIVYSPNAFDSGFVVVAESEHPAYAGTGDVSLPYQIVYDQQATISNTGMTFAFGTTTQATVLVVYDFTPSSPIVGDYDGNGLVDSGDFVRWRDTYGSTTILDADGTGDFIVDSADYALWRENYPGGQGYVKAMPEPRGFVVVSALTALAAMSRTSRAKNSLFCTHGEANASP